MQQGSTIGRSTVAKGALLAMFARSGAAIEAVAQPLYIWLFGLSAYGIFITIWAGMNLVSKVVDLSMTSALQRLIPGESDAHRVHAVLRGAFMLGVAPAILVAIAVHTQAEGIAQFLSSEFGQPVEARVVACFAWALPLWTFVEIATSAVRAKGAFGPEIRLRIFWEQIMRLGFALALFRMYPGAAGLSLAYLGSLCLTVLLSIRLLSKQYDLRLAFTSHRIPLGPILTTGLALMPTNLSRRLLIDAPPMLLVALIPAGGAVAAGLFEVARKISTIAHVVRQAFHYVLAPLSAAQARSNRAEVQPLYRFACRLSTALAVPLAAFIACAGRDILSVYRAETLAALPALYILVTARGIEAMVGPASAVVEMIGHRVLPLLNSALGIAVWFALALALTPDYGLIGMTAAVGLAMIVMAGAAALELRVSDAMHVLDRWSLAGLAGGLGGTILMIAAASFLSGPGRFFVLVVLWLVTTWTALRVGLEEEDRSALGVVGARLRLGESRLFRKT